MNDYYEKIFLEEKEESERRRKEFKLKNGKQMESKIAASSARLAAADENMPTY